MRKIFCVLALCLIPVVADAINPAHVAANTVAARRRAQQRAECVRLGGEVEKRVFGPDRCWWRDGTYTYVKDLKK